MRTVNDIVTWLIQSGALVTIFIFAWKYLKPVMVEKQKHAKTVQERELLSLVNSLADNAVNSLVSVQGVTGSDKFKQATKIVGSTLADKGFDVQQETVEHAVQAAYEKSDLTGKAEPATGSLIPKPMAPAQDRLSGKGIPSENKLADRKEADTNDSSNR